jgi:hypothetical protein
MVGQLACLADREVAKAADMMVVHQRLQTLHRLQNHQPSDCEEWVRPELLSEPIVD